MGSPLKSLMLKLLWHAVDIKRRVERPTVIAVTGSVGKTSTKEAIAGVLQASDRPVVKTYGNLNTETGVALSLLGFKESPRGLSDWIKVGFRCLLPPIKPSRRAPIYVLEFSADQPGDIGFLSKRFALDVAVITSIVPAHMGRYKNFEALVNEKFSIVSGLKPDGVLVLNADDPVQVERSGELKDKNILWYGVTPGVSKRLGVWAHGVRIEEGGLVATIQSVVPRMIDSIGHSQVASLKVHTKLLGTHQLYSLLAATAVASTQKLSLDACAEFLEAYSLPAGRGRLIDGAKEIIIVDDSYNASPESMKSGLSMLRAVAGPRRVVAVLGNMNELGDMEAQAHTDVGAFAAGKVDFLVAVGPNGKRMAEAAKAAGQAGHTVMSFSTPEALISKIDQIVKRKDLIYIKGSQNGVFLERLVKRLMAEPSRASELLVRQSAYWADKHTRKS